MTKIEWVKSADGSRGQTWNPIVGCSVTSPGCTNCYAMNMARRCEAMGTAHYAGTTTVVNSKAVWTGKIAQAPDSTLLAPLRRRKPTTYFVNSMGDLFHEAVPDELIDRVFAVMALCPQHTFQVLTKRSARMRQYCSTPDRLTIVREQGFVDHGGRVNGRHARDIPTEKTWPLPNVWLGVSAENQRTADERIPDLLATPAAVMFVSAEPLLGPICLTDTVYNDQTGYSHQGFLRDKCESDDYRHHSPKLDLVIVGGESGPAARDNDFITNARSLLAQCQAAGVPFFGKQNVGKKPLPDDLMERQLPEVHHG
ncbi:MAG: phage Gp37/Gp68 family protein [Rhodopseudomonas palustris]|nr:phage Gp37/Gp68 family protein [Rhodopseudomonas palustris]